MSIISFFENIYRSDSVQLFAQILKQLSNNYVLNISIHFLLILFISIILLSIIAEMTVVPRGEYISFLIWVSSYFVRLCACTAMFVTLKNMPDSKILFWLQLVIFGMSLIIRVFLGYWFLQYVRTGCHVPSWLFHLYPVIVSGLTTTAVILSNYLDFPEIVYLGQAIVYILVFMLVLLYRKAAEISLASLWTAGILGTAIACIQPFWMYTPGNVSGTAFLLIIYLRIWQRRQVSMLETLKNLDDTTAELNESRRSNMLNQIQPHFVYNTLSTIAALCGTNPGQAQLVTEQFSTYLRENIHLGNMKSLCPFPEELEHIRTYLSIERVRFGERLNVKYDLEETDFLIPALSVQPIVENAVKHGIMQKAGGGTVIISTRIKGDHVVLTVADNGVGFDINKVRKGTGLNYAGECIKTMLHTNMTIQSVSGKGTTVKILTKRGT